MALTKETALTENFDEKMNRLEPNELVIIRIDAEREE